MVPAAELQGLPGLPGSRKGILKWARRISGSGSNNNGNRVVLPLSDLPADVRRAWLERQAEEAGVDPGCYDDAAHLVLAKESAKVQARAHDRAAKLLFITKREALGLTWPEIKAAGDATFDKFPSRNPVKDWKELTKGIDPANWAPALADNYTGNDAQAHPISDEAFEMFCGAMYFGGKNGTGQPLKMAYREVAEEAERQGWDWPKFHTVRRRWNKECPVRRMFMQRGAEEAAKRLRLRQPQHERHLAANDVWDGDGREFKVQCEWPDGSVGCPVVVALVDRASRKTVGYAVGQSENAEVAEAALANACDTHGLPIRIVFDNGSAFNSKRIAGGLQPTYRTKQTRDADWAIPGVLRIYGIELGNTGVGAKTSNLQENVWSHLRHVDNHPAFHGAQRSGPNDPAVNGEAVDIALFERVLAKEIARLNTATDNRVKGLAKGESRDMAFSRLLTDNAKRRAVTPLMKRRRGMIWKRRTVQQDGRIRFDNGLFGDAETQLVMLRYGGKFVLVGFDPKDFRAPAMVCTWEGDDKPGRLILEKLPAVTPTAHGSAEGRRKATTEARRMGKIERDLRKRFPEEMIKDFRRIKMGYAPEAGEPVDADVVALPERPAFAPGDAEAAEGVSNRTVSYLSEQRKRNLAEANDKRLQGR